MATDDTATAAAGDCQIEAWGEGVAGVRAACGLTDTLELDGALSRIQGGGAAPNGMVLGLKWVPPRPLWDTALGTVRLARSGPAPAAKAGKTDSAGLVGLSGLEISPTWSVYANLATTRNLETGRHVNEVRLALAWQPIDRVLLFVEGLRDNDSNNVRNAGFGLWAIPEVLGLDVVIMRSTAGGPSLSIGFGWYGIRLP